MHQCQSRAEFHFSILCFQVSPCAHCFSEGLSCLYSERPRDDFWQPESCLSKGVVRQCDWASSCPCWPVQHSPLHFHSSLIAFFFNWVSNKSANWSCLLRKQMKGWRDTKGRAEANDWKLMRKEEGAQLTPSCGSKLPVWLRPHLLTSKTVFPITNLLEWIIQHAPQKN